MVRVGSVALTSAELGDWKGTRPCQTIRKASLSKHVSSSRPFDTFTLSTRVQVISIFRLPIGDVKCPTGIGRKL